MKRARGRHTLAPSSYSTMSRQMGSLPTTTARSHPQQHPREVDPLKTENRMRRQASA